MKPQLLVRQPTATIQSKRLAHKSTESQMHVPFSAKLRQCCYGKYNCGVAANVVENRQFRSWLYLLGNLPQDLKAS
jgi:hypothetical protein